MAETGEYHPAEARAVAPHRQVWDSLTLQGERFMIVTSHEYEEQSFEVYRLDENGWNRVFAFAFATVGG